MHPTTHLASLIDALKSIDQVDELVRHPYDFKPVDGSPASAELAQQHVFRGSWSEEPLAEVLMVGDLMLFAAEDHFRALRAVVEEDTTRYGEFTLLRAAFELSSQAWWIFDPLVDLTERFARGANFHLKSHREAQKLESEAGVDTARSAVVNSILETARTAGLPTTDSRSNQRWVRQQPPSTTQLCRIFLADSPALEAQGALVYRFLSATQHGMLHGLISSPQDGAPTALEGRVILTGQRDNYNLLMLSRAVLAAYLKAMRCQVNYYGWVTTEWTAWLRRFLKHFPPYQLTPFPA